MDVTGMLHLTRASELAQGLVQVTLRKLTQYIPQDLHCEPRE